ncbi:MAG TPA: hypothetical protein VLG74_11260 [Blastocatellia bacterium]|nr:hypothetical protein [Blastocatellia bacterium]
MLRKLVALFIFSLLTLPAGCSLLSHEAPPEDIDKAAALFFQRFGNEEYNAIYNDAAKAFKDNQTHQTVTDNLKQMAENGKTIQFERISMTFQGEGKSRMAMPVYRTSSESARAEITLTFQDESGEWKLFGFAYKPRS